MIKPYTTTKERSSRGREIVREIDPIAVIPFDQIDDTPAREARALRKDKIVKEYKRNYEALEKGEVMMCSDKNGKPWKLVSGYYRLLAAKKKGLKEDSFQNGGSGTWTEICTKAIGANTKHGEKLTRDDLIKNDKDLQKLHPDWSMSKRARFMGRNPTNYMRSLKGINNNKPNKHKNPRERFVVHHQGYITRGIERVCYHFKEGCEIKPFHEWTPLQQKQVKEAVEQFRKAFKKI